MKQIWTVIAKGSSIDRDLNNISLFDCVEQINLGLPDDLIEQLRMLPVELVIVSLWRRSDPAVPESGKARLLWEIPDGRKGPLLLEQYVPLEGAVRARTRARLLEIPFLGFGTYWLHVVDPSNEDSIYASVPLEIVRDESFQLTPPPPPQAEGG